MSASAVRRLLRVRNLIEEQHRAAVESAVGELRRLERALDAARDRVRDGRKTVASSARSGEVVDRIAGLVCGEAAQCQSESLVPRIAASESEAARRMQQYLDKRTEKRQAETLIRESEAQVALEAGRREQQSLDDWFGSRGRDRSRSEEESGKRTKANRIDRARH